MIGCLGGEKQAGTARPSATEPAEQKIEGCGVCLRACKAERYSGAGCPFSSSRTR